VNGLLSVVFHEADIAAVQAFSFGVITFRGADPANPAIDSGGQWTYTLATAPVVKPKPVTVTSTSVVAASPPKAGASFRVAGYAVNLSDGSLVDATAVRCTATLGGKKITGTGAGGCTFKLPKTAKKKRLVVKVSGVYNGARISKTVTYVVR
jgi:hypothetical protein